jgi:hypothetical protein
VQTGPYGIFDLSPRDCTPYSLSETRRNLSELGRIRQFGTGWKIVSLDIERRCEFESLKLKEMPYIRFLSLCSAKASGFVA